MEHTLITEPSADYELVDSGNGEKLERYGAMLLRRPDPQILWNKTLPDTEWKKADAVYERGNTSGKWNALREVPQPWKVSIDGLTFLLKLLPSKHVGLFPEHASTWKWLEDVIGKRVEEGNKVFVLNLFAYTGGASLAAAKAGAEVVHLDASKYVVDAAHANLDASELGEKPVRFIVDDVRKFVEREIKRGNKYDVIVMDPPVYGKGANDEVWKIEEDLLPLVIRVREILSDNPLAIVLNGYASGYSHETYKNILSHGTHGFKGTLVSGELMIRESSGGRLLPAGIFARFEN